MNASTPINYPLLSQVQSPADLRRFSLPELERLAREMRLRLMEVVDRRGGHLASNLGVVELTIALHRAYDFLVDRVVWDTSHQTYGHKLLTGRNELFESLRQYQGCCGFASKDESPFDFFDAGHAGTGISAALGMAVGEGVRPDGGRCVAVVGDSAMAAGMSIEALNHAGHLRQDLLVVLNDNRMSIDVSVGALSKYLNRLRTGGFYRGLKRDVQQFVPRIPLVGRPLEEGLEQLHGVVRQALVPGQFFEELGFRYFGPIDGHDLEGLLEFLVKLREMQGPLLLHVLTNKGHGFEPAQADPIKYHASRGFLNSDESREPVKVEPAPPKAPTAPTFTKVFADTIVELGKRDSAVHAVTAAMPGGTGLAAFQKEFPDRYHDVGIAEQHGVTFGSGLAFAGLKPVVAVYSTFLQRGFDQVVHDVCLQQNRVVFALDRSGLVEDGPTHHGVFDIAYLRPIPGIALAAPADAAELEEMLTLAVDHEVSTAIRYAKATAPQLARERERAPIEWGRAEVLRDPADVTILAYGSMVEIALEVADQLDYPVGVVNLRFAKPLDRELLRSLASPRRKLITLEEGVIAGGVGSAVLEAVHAEGLEFDAIHLWGIPDEFVTFGARTELLRELRLDHAGLTARLEELRPASRGVGGGSRRPSVGGIPNDPS